MDESFTKKHWMFKVNSDDEVSAGDQESYAQPKKVERRYSAIERQPPVKAKSVGDVNYESGRNTKCKSSKDHEVSVAYNYARDKTKWRNAREIYKIRIRGKLPLS